MLKSKPFYFDAVLSLVGGTLQGGTDISKYKFFDGQTPPSKAEADAEFLRLNTEYDAEEYARNRVTDYPDMGSQLNKIYDDGVTKWKSEMVDPVKAKWPKDNSGPV